jgi:GntR family transcriptional regulator
MHSGVVLGRADSRPIYIQIIEQVRQRIALGDWPAGYELPSIRQLAGELRVSVITVKRAYLELERDGVIITRQGKGSTVADVPALPSRILEEEMTEQIARLAERAVMLGLTSKEVQSRVAEAMRRATEGM